jgi:hypothetical protein
MQHSKSDRIKEALEAGDCLKALRIASRFYDRSIDTAVFKRGFDAYQHPRFYLQLGKDPDRLVAEAVVRLWRRFGFRELDVEVFQKSAARSKQEF